MAGTPGPPPDPVIFFTAVQAAPYRHGLFALLRRIESLYADRPRLGRSQRAVDDPVRLGQEPELIFAPATLARCEPADGGVWRIFNRAFGLFGPNGPLPLHLTEYARERSYNQRDRSFSRFVDLLHHRLLSLFYRAWADAQPTVGLDRPREDRFAFYIACLFGLAPEALRRRDALPDLYKFHFAGRLAPQVRNAEGLVALLTGYFEVPVRVDEFVGEWLQLPPDAQNRLGRRGVAELGQSCLLGARAYSRDGRLRIVLGPLRLRQYARFLPGGASLARLVAAVRLYAGDYLACELNLVLCAAEIPPLALDGTAQLGYTGWLPTATGVRADAGDLGLNLHDHHA